VRKTTKRKVKVAMVGAGAMANAVHYPSLAEMKDVQILAIAELNEQRLNETADKYGVSGRYRDYKKMIEQTDPDAVYVIMPPHHLFDIVADVLEMGKHCCIEKPPGLMAEQTRQLARLAERNDCLTMTLFNRRFIPGLVQAKKAVDKEGPVLLCVASFYKNYFGGGPYYRGASDVLSCDAVHAVDTLRWMSGGEAGAVASCVDSWYMDFDNAFNALIRFDNGAVGVLRPPVSAFTGSKSTARESLPSWIGTPPSTSTRTTPPPAQKPSTKPPAAMRLTMCMASLTKTATSSTASKRVSNPPVILRILSKRWNWSRGFTGAVSNEPAAS